jgi:hypothetical protein
MRYAGAVALEKGVLFDQGQAEGGEDEAFAGAGGDDDGAFLEDAVAAEGGGNAAHGFMGDGGHAGADFDFAAERGAGLFVGLAEGRQQDVLRDAELREGVEVGRHDLIDGAVVGAEKAFAGELGCAEAVFQGFVFGRFLHKFSSDL